MTATRLTPMSGQLLYHEGGVVYLDSEEEEERELALLPSHKELDKKFK